MTGILPLLATSFLLLAPAAPSAAESSASVASAPAAKKAKPAKPSPAAVRDRQANVFIPAMVAGVIGVGSGVTALVLSSAVGFVSTTAVLLVFLIYMNWDKGLLDVETTKSDTSWCTSEECTKARIWKYGITTMILSMVVGSLGLVATGAGVGALIGGLLSKPVE